MSSRFNLNIQKQRYYAQEYFTKGEFWHTKTCIALSTMQHTMHLKTKNLTQCIVLEIKISDNIYIS